VVVLSGMPENAVCFNFVIGRLSAMDRFIKLLTKNTKYQRFGGAQRMSK